MIENAHVQSSQKSNKHIARQSQIQATSPENKGGIMYHATPQAVWFDGWVGVSVATWSDGWDVVFWGLPMRDMTHSYVHVTHSSVRHDLIHLWDMNSFICKTWSHSYVRHDVIHMWDMTHSYMRHDLIHMWDMTHSYVRHDSFICETWLIHMCDMISFICETWSYSYVRYDSFICETWSHSYVRYDLIHMWDLTAVWYSHVLTFICSRLIVFIYCIHILSFDKAHATSCFEVTHSYVWHDSFICVTWLVHNVWHDSFIGETRLIHMWDMTHSHARHDSCICETWLVHMWNTTHYQLIRQNDVVFWGLLMWDMTRSHVRHDSVICAT